MTHYAANRTTSPDRVLARATGAQEGELVPDVVYDVLRSPGEPLDVATRAATEPRFGHDFSRVRVHVGERAGESADAVGANAYAVGSHLVARGGLTFEANGPLLLHELSHVVQQGDREVPATGLTIAPPSSVAEREARAAGGGTTPLTGLTPLAGPTVLLRDPKPATAPGKKTIVVNLNKQTATALVDGKPVKTMPISSGKPGFRTRTGQFQIQEPQAGDRNHKSSSYGKCVSKKTGKSRSGSQAGCKGDEKYVGAPMNYYKRVYPQTGFHEGSTAVPSHGCIHLEKSDAAWMWEWADKGTSVFIEGGKSNDAKPKPKPKPTKPKAGKKTAALDSAAAGGDALQDEEVMAALELAEAEDVEGVEESDDEYEAWWDESEEANA